MVAAVVNPKYVMVLYEYNEPSGVKYEALLFTGDKVEVSMEEADAILIYINAQYDNLDNEKRQMVLSTLN